MAAKKLVKTKAKAKVGVKKGKAPKAKAAKGSS